MAFGLHFVRSLKFKLVFTALSAVLVALAVEAVAAHWSGIRTISAVTKGNLTSMYNSAKSRVATFNEARWRDMAQLSSEAGLALEGRGGGDIDGLLRGNLTRIAYFNEIFVADAEWNIVASTDAGAVGTKVGRRDAKRAVDDGADKYIDGPYVDEKTRELGASTSRFHDAVTLMYYAPIMRDGQRVGVVGARLPNDVLSDILQADESHIYRATGDTYFFALGGNDGIAPGTALSRSRFEDESVVAGPNLKSGLQAADGSTVRVKDSTEFELLFRDPASKSLTQAVRQIVDQGSFEQVDSSGYSDYRHLPTVGVGGTVQLEGAPQAWGLISEADVQEAFEPVQAADKLGFFVSLFMACASAVMLLAVILRPMNLLALLSGQIRETADSVNSASQAVGRSASSLASSATDQASAIAETMASMEEITAMVAANNESARQAHDRAQMNADDAATGSSVVAEVQQAMRAIAEQNTELAKVVEIIENISEKTKVINDIVFETKLLSFNASIEAARAGEQGKGFAVVAEEVGNLARLSGKAAQEISALIEQSTKQVHNMVQVTRETITDGIKVTERAKSAFDSISVGVRNVSQMMDAVALSSQEQQQGIGQVSKAMSQMDSLTQNTSAASADASAQSTDLKTAGDRLRGVVTDLEVLVGGAHANGSKGGRRGPPKRRPSEGTAGRAKQPLPESGVNDGEYDVEQAGMEAMPQFNDSAFG